jgi:tRNA(fMet)-specific endonuclease VapC
VKYLLDTDTASYFLRGNVKLRKRLSNTSGQWGISAITHSELAALLFRTKNATLEEILTEFLKDVETVAFGRADALEAGRLKALLEKAGSPIGAADTLIAGHALSLDVTLVTNNTKHFSKVPELKVANWAE